MQVIGKIKVINPTEKVGETFRKRDLVVTTDEQYPQQISIQFMQDKCDILDKYVVGQLVNVSINLRGREWANPEGVIKYFNTIEGWRIEKQEAAPIENKVEAQIVSPAIEEIESDDLPF